MKILYVLFPVLFFACTGTEQKVEVVSTSDAVTQNIDTLELQRLEKVSRVVDRLPSPKAILEIIKLSGNELDVSLLTDDAKFQRTVTPFDQSLLLGAYFTDVAYSTIYAQPQMTMNYTAGVQQLCENLGMSGIITEETINSLENSMDNQGQLLNVLSDLYEKVDKELQSLKRDEVAAAVTVGTWIEAFYIATHLENQTEEVKTKLIGEKGVINDLHELVFLFDSENWKKVQNQVESLHRVYEKSSETLDFEQLKTVAQAMVQIIRK